jgi:hypothetical protein
VVVARWFLSRYVQSLSLHISERQFESRARVGRLSDGASGVGQRDGVGVSGGPVWGASLVVVLGGY